MKMETRAKRRLGQFDDFVNEQMPELKNDYAILKKLIEDDKNDVEFKGFLDKHLIPAKASKRILTALRNNDELKTKKKVKFINYFESIRCWLDEIWHRDITQKEFEVYGHIYYPNSYEKYDYLKDVVPVQ